MYLREEVLFLIGGSSSSSSGRRRKRMRRRRVVGGCSNIMGVILVEASTPLWAEQAYTGGKGGEEDYH